MQHDPSVAANEHETGFSENRNVPREIAQGLDRGGQAPDDPEPLAIGEGANGAK